MTVLIHLKNPITITLPDGSDIATECIRRDSDGTFSVRMDLFSETGEWVRVPHLTRLQVPESEIANVERIGPQPPTETPRWGTSDEKKPRV